MDRECVTVLPRVCEVLAASGSSLPDDTSLEKLLDWFTALTKDGVSLLEAFPCLLDFIPTVVNNSPASDASILSFTLKLTGLISATENGFKVLQEHSVCDLVFDPQRWQEAGLWKDPCIRIGWIQGLRTMLQHSKALGFFVQADLIEPLLHLHTDTSLFVASAANHMLAHILLFCQSENSQNNSKHPTVPVETKQNYSAVTVKICEYLKRSLVLDGTSALLQSHQALKVLALLLSRAGPDLRDRLLLTVSDSLEELVTTNCSQLTRPLMDVVQAAHSSKSEDHALNQRVDRLLSIMLNTGKPADLSYTAAAFLRSGHDDCVHKAQAARVLLLPLDIITGLSLLGQNSTADKLRLPMMEYLKSKSSCISMICASLANTPQITLMDPDCLPCPPVLIVSAVLSLLRLCNGDGSSSSGCAEAGRNLIVSGKVQKCALDVLSVLSNSSGGKVLLAEVFTLLMQYLNSPASEPTVLQKSYRTLIKWISACADLSSITDQLRKDLIQVVGKRVCDVRWEVRDSTVEFLGHLAGLCDTSEVLLGDRCFTVSLLKEALQDPESYVRASSISALAQTLAPSWQQGAAPTREQVELVSRLHEILSQDTEGFSRRAVLQYFITWFSLCSSPTSCSLLMQSMHAVLSQGSADLDWEVKVHTLELAELLMDRVISGLRGYSNEPGAHPHPYAVTSNKVYKLQLHSEAHTWDGESDLVGVLSTLVDQGVFLVLLGGLVDCDRPVGLKACQLLMRLRDSVCPLLLGDQRVSAPDEPGVSCELPGCGWAQEVRKILGIEDADPAQKSDVVDPGDDRKPEQGGVRDEGCTVRVSVCEVLRSLGLDARLSVLTQSSDHVHNSPMSLLQDILTAGSRNTQLNSEPGLEVIVDCY
uniref:BRCA1-associated ATM activator 1 n=3 Tax=Nothobranchius kuhntae TaxID=321403 RepID=A0A1A8IRP1_NOTKU